MKISAQKLNMLLDCYACCSAKDGSVPAIKHTRDSLHNYSTVTPLAHGCYGDVFIVQHKQTSKLYALKRISKTKIKRQPHVALYMEERNCLIACSTLKYSIGLISAFQDSSFIYFIMPFCEGGDLLSLLAKHENLTEDQIVFYISELLLAINELHSHNWLHRDIKPENILLNHDGHVRLADFGSCVQISPNGRVYSEHPVGTPDYISPEVLASANGTAEGYSFEVDVWSAGVVLFEMVNGHPPFESSRLQETYKMISRIEYVNEQGSTDLRKLIGFMVCSVEKRYSVKQLLEHIVAVFKVNLNDLTPPFVPEQEWSVNFCDIGIEEDDENTEFGYKGFIGFTYDKNVAIQEEIDEIEVKSGDKNIDDKLEFKAKDQNNNDKIEVKSGDKNIDDKIEIKVKDQNINYEIKLKNGDQIEADNMEAKTKDGNINYELELKNGDQIESDNIEAKIKDQNINYKLELRNGDQIESDNIEHRDAGIDVSKINSELDSKLDTIECKLSTNYNLDRNICDNVSSKLNVSTSSQSAGTSSVNKLKLRVINSPTTLQNNITYQNIQKNSTQECQRSAYTEDGSLSLAMKNINTNSENSSFITDPLISDSKHSDYKSIESNENQHFYSMNQQTQIEEIVLNFKDTHNSNNLSNKIHNENPSINASNDKSHVVSNNIYSTISPMPSNNISENKSHLTSLNITTSDNAFFPISPCLNDSSSMFANTMEQNNQFINITEGKIIETNNNIDKDREEFKNLVCKLNSLNINDKKCHHEIVSIHKTNHKSIIRCSTCFYEKDLDCDIIHVLLNKQNAGNIVDIIKKDSCVSIKNNDYNEKATQDNIQESYRNGSKITKDVNITTTNTSFTLHTNATNYSGTDSSTNANISKNLLKFHTQEIFSRIKMYLEAITNQQKLMYNLMKQCYRENKLLKRELRKKESQIDLSNLKLSEEIKKELKITKNEVKEIQQKLDSEIFLKEKLQDEIKYLTEKLKQNTKIKKIRDINLMINILVNIEKKIVFKECKLEINNRFCCINGENFALSNIFIHNLKENELFNVSEKHRKLIVKLVILNKQLRRYTNLSSIKSEEELMLELNKEKKILLGLENLLKAVPNNSIIYEKAIKQKEGSLKRIEELSKDMSVKHSQSSLCDKESAYGSEISYYDNQSISKFSDKCTNINKNSATQDSQKSCFVARKSTTNISIHSKIKEKQTPQIKNNIIMEEELKKEQPVSTDIHDSLGFRNKNSLKFDDPDSLNTENKKSENISHSSHSTNRNQIKTNLLNERKISSSFAEFLSNDSQIAEKTLKKNTTRTPPEDNPFIIPSNKKGIRRAFKEHDDIPTENNYKYPYNIPNNKTNYIFKDGKYGLAKTYEFNNHTFKQISFSDEHICDHCNQLLYGNINQGLKCKDCNMIVHNSCYVLIEESCEMFKAASEGKVIYILLRSIEDKNRLLSVFKI